MSATAADSKEVSQRVLASLVEYFDVDVSFLRHNDHSIRASRLIAEWPPRPDIPDPDPLALIYFADADPVFALSENGKKPAVFRPERFLERTFTAWEYLPFGVGVRKCIGWAFALYTMKMVLGTILSHFRLQLQEPQRVVPRRRPFNVEPRGGVRMIPYAHQT